MYRVEIRYSSAGAWIPFPQRFDSAETAETFKAQQEALEPAPTREWSCRREYRIQAVVSVPRQSNRRRYRWSNRFSGRYTLHDATVPVIIQRVRRSHMQANGQYLQLPPTWDLFVGGTCVATKLPTFGACEALVPAEAIGEGGR